MLGAVGKSHAGMPGACLKFTRPVPCMGCASRVHTRLQEPDLGALFDINRDYSQDEQLNSNTQWSLVAMLCVVLLAAPLLVEAIFNRHVRKVQQSLIGPKDLPGLKIKHPNFCSWAVS